MKVWTQRNINKDSEKLHIWNIFGGNSYRTYRRVENRIFEKRIMAIDLILSSLSLKKYFYVTNTEKQCFFPFSSLFISSLTGSMAFFLNFYLGHHNTEFKTLKNIIPNTQQQQNQANKKCFLCYQGEEKHFVRQCFLFESLFCLSSSQ